MQDYALIVTVYVEVVIFNNLVLDALLVVATLIARRRKPKVWRVLLAAAIGSGVAVGYAVAPLAWQVVIRVLLAPLLTAVFDRYKSVKDFGISLILFSALTFALGGITSGIGNIIGVDLNNYIILGVTALGALIGMTLLAVIVRKRASTAKKTCEVVIQIAGKQYVAKGMCDTGNSLTDVVSGLPVVIVSQRFEDRLNGISDDIKANRGVKADKFNNYENIDKLNGIGENVKPNGVVKKCKTNCICENIKINRICKSAKLRGMGVHINLSSGIGDDKYIRLDSEKPTQTDNGRDEDSGKTVKADNGRDKDCRKTVKADNYMDKDSGKPIQTDNDRDEDCRKTVQTVNYMDKDSGKTTQIDGYIEVSTVNGQSSMPLIKIDNICIADKHFTAYGALSRKSFNGYDIILQNTLF